MILSISKFKADPALYQSAGNSTLPGKRGGAVPGSLLGSFTLSMRAKSGKWFRRKQCVEHSFRRDDRHTGDGEVQIEYDHSREKEEEEGEEDGADKELIQVVVARVYTVSQNVVLLPAKEMKEGDEDIELPVINTCRGQVEGIDGVSV